MLLADVQRAMVMAVQWWVGWSLVVPQWLYDVWGGRRAGQHEEVLLADVQRAMVVVVQQVGYQMRR